MQIKSLNGKRLIIIHVVFILLSAIFAILLHALLPASADITQLDGILVKWFGFPAVSTFYFILLFTHCTLAVRYMGVRADVSGIQIGIRLGIAFAMIYILGMQELAFKGSPFAAWGLGFVKYQLIMGIGDGLPAFLLCLALACFTLRNGEQSKPINKLTTTQCLKVMAVFALAIFAERTIGYESGLISSESGAYPVPCYIWTGLFGVLMGYTYMILYPLLAFKTQQYSVPLRFSAIIGLNWMIFNSFIGLIMKGAMFQMILRSGLDIAVLFLVSILVDKYIIKSNGCKELT